MAEDENGRMSSPARTTNLALSFLLELVALVALALWSAHVGTSTWAGVVLATVAVALWATVWGLCFSPRARAGLSATAKQVGQAGMFAVAVLALGLAGHWALAAVFGGVAAVNRTLMAVWGQERAQQALRAV